MKLVIGGYAQGKLEYVLSTYQLQADRVWEGVLPKDGECMEETVVVYQLHRWVRKRILEGGCPEEEIQSFLEGCKDCILICDEIGSGIVPAEPFERQYRERTGRILIQLAARAEEVWRILCGIGQRIK
ncbi:MAG: bifunctional adenosylcobinamide kinase/adenosylcobinamide-phosphate guanylyltransferase [Eubacterium sp.]|nr:bifunctional adenosylcobinamide kinase/adenosylcobinamide-phosphate guanylyltransferase [Eubacterium sp.]